MFDPKTEEAQQDADRSLVKHIYDHATQLGIVGTVECFIAAMNLLGHHVELNISKKEI